MTVFKSPQRFEECRICDLFVNEKNPPAELFEKHHSDWVTGCPIFMALTTFERFRESRRTTGDPHKEEKRSKTKEHKKTLCKPGGPEAS